MMRINTRSYFLLLLLTLFLLSPGFAQPGEKQNIPTELETIVPFGDVGYVIIMLNDLESPSRMALRLYSHEEELLAERELGLKKQGLLTQFEGAFAWNGQLCILTSLYYPGPKRNNLIYESFDIPNLDDIEAKIVDEAYSPEQYRIPFGYHKSEDEEYLAFYSWTYTLPEDPPKLSVKVFNPALEQVWSQRYLLPFKNETFYIYDVAVNSEGKVFIFCENYLGKPGRIINNEKIQHFILAAEEGNPNLQQYDLNLPNQVIKGLKMKLDKSGSLIGAAFIQDAKKKNMINGLYLINIPPDGKSIQRSQVPLNDEMYKAAYPYGEKESIFNPNRHRFSQFVIDYLWQEEDGSWVISSEYRNGTDSYMTEMEFNDIMVLKVNKDLNRMEWMKRLAKRQSGFPGNWPILSYRAFQKRGNYFFLFNDNADNHKQEGNPNTLDEYEGQNTAIILMQVSADGEVSKNDITSLARKERVSEIWPSRIWEVKDKSRVLLYGEHSMNFSNIAGVLFSFAWGEDLR